MNPAWTTTAAPCGCSESRCGAATVRIPCATHAPPKRTVHTLRVKRGARAGA